MIYVGTSNSKSLHSITDNFFIKYSRQIIWMPQITITCTSTLTGLTEYSTVAEQGVIISS